MRMSKTEGFMRCTGCGIVWKGQWDAEQTVTCPECQSPLEEVQEAELQQQ